MDTVIREAVVDDAQVIAALSGQLGYEMSIEHTQTYLSLLLNNDKDTVVVAIYNGMVVAWMHVFYALRVETLPFCEIAGLVVDENIRGRGIGKLLIAYAKDWCRKMNGNSLRVRTNMIRTDTHRFYQQAGFILTKEQKVFTMEV